MPYHDSSSPSPAKRPSLAERSSSSPSVSKASPSGAAPSTSHKGSTHKLFKAHAVGHNRVSHTRVPSYGKGLHKLTKIEASGGDGVVNTHSRTKSHTPPTSPSTQSFKRNSSTGALPRTKSKASVKKNSSELSLKRNGSTAHLGKTVRLDSTSRQHRAHNGKSKSAKFSVGSEGHDDDQEEEWTEDNNSHSSPATTRIPTRQNSIGPSLPRPRTPPIIDGTTDRPYSNTSQPPPQTPPESPPGGSNRPSNHRQESSYSAHQFPDADALTKRLLQGRSSHNLAPQMSSVSATATSTGTHSPRSITRSQNQNEASMPSDGISRFLSNGGSSSGSATPGSLTQLQSTLSHLHNNHPQTSTSTSTTSDPQPSSSFEPARRVKSAGHLAGPSASTSPTPTNTRPTSRSSQRQSSNYPSALDRKDPSQPSRTQLKLELQRQQSSVSNAPHAPVVQNGVVRVGGERGAEDRKERAWETVVGEIANCRRFRNPVAEAVGRVGRRESRHHMGRNIESDRDGEDAEEVAGTGRSGAGSRPVSRAERGRVRFEFGGRERDGDDEDDGEDGNEEGDAVQGLLRRLWQSGETVVAG